MSKAQDPFAPTTDPSLYVPRPASEKALDALIEGSVKGTQHSLLLGPTGMGKSLLLRVLARRAEGDLHCIHVPVPTLDPEGVTLWISTRLPGGRRPAGTEALLEVANERPLLLLVEDAELLPAESAQTLAELHSASSGAIRAILAVNDTECPEHLALAFEPGAQQVALSDAMTRDEVADYVARRLAAAGVPQSVAEHFGSSAIAQIHDSSGGVPMQVNHAARRMMPSAARSLAPTLPDAGLWQDPEPPLPPEIDLPPEPVLPRRTRASWRRGRGLGWGIAAGLVPFIAGITIGVWMRPTAAPEDEQGADRVAEEAEAPVNTEISAPTLPAAPPLPTDPETVADAKATSPVAPIDGAAQGESEVPSAARTEVAAPPAVADDAAESLAASASSNPSQVASPPPRDSAATIADSVATAATEPTETRVFGEPELDAEGVRATPVIATTRPSQVGEALPEFRAEPVQEEAARPPEVASLPNSPPGAAVTGATVPGSAVVGATPPGSSPSFTQRPFPEDVATPRPGASFANELFLDSEPPAFIEIDGRPVGATPIRVDGLRPGPHRLVAHFETGETMTREVVVGSERSEVMLRGPMRRTPRASVPPGAGNFEP